MNAIATITPAIPGATTLDALSATWLSATALARRSSPTSSTTQACRAGPMNANIAPTISDPTKRCQSAI